MCASQADFQANVKICIFNNKEPKRNSKSYLSFINFLQEDEDFFFFFYIKRALAKGKQKYVKKFRLSPDPAKKTVEEKKQGMEVRLTLEVS